MSLSPLAVLVVMEVKEVKEEARQLQVAVAQLEEKLLVLVAQAPLMAETQVVEEILALEVRVQVQVQGQVQLMEGLAAEMPAVEGQTAETQVALVV